MPHCLIAGVAVSAPRIDDFPQSGLPRSSINIKADDGMIYAIIGHETAAAAIEALQIGDCLSAQGLMVLETRIEAGRRIIVEQITPLRRRSVANRVASVSARR